MKKTRRLLSLIMASVMLTLSLVGNVYAYTNLKNDELIALPANSCDGEHKHSYTINIGSVGWKCERCQGYFYEYYNMCECGDVTTIYASHKCFVS